MPRLFLSLALSFLLYSQKWVTRHHPLVAYARPLRTSLIVCAAEIPGWDFVHFLRVLEQSPSGEYIDVRAQGFLLSSRAMHAF